MVSLRSFALTRNQRLMPKRAKKPVAKQAKVEPGHSESSQVQHEAPEATPSRFNDLKNQLELHSRDIKTLLATNERLETTIERHEATIERHEATNQLQARTNEDLEDRLHTTSLAAAGDRAAINKIRNRILLDLGPKKLSRIHMPLQELGDLKVPLSKLGGFGPLGRAVSEHVRTFQDQCKLEGARASDVGTTNVTATDRNAEGWRCHST
ncbi:hypothetical protein BS47DRAFT_417666 [Hydnum rufescens UP504]|uniref:Uncharacterized protein n=1 Tax=Hydnum rufescens UP504 TaxID=1448309 RepID=A0A9P6DXY2_9AGAM|nr:hypothetical protein BS47DRAFT_417666 [Hydnum rufescens UP504]